MLSSKKPDSDSSQKCALTKTLSKDQRITKETCLVPLLSRIGAKLDSETKPLMTLYIALLVYLMASNG